jgi:hypothetical protein
MVLDTNMYCNKTIFWRMMIGSMTFVATPLWGKCEDETHTPKSGNLESSKTPENSELDCKGQNTSHWSVFYTIGKVLKCRCPNWTRMIWTSQYKLWSKEGPGVKLAVWLPTTKSRESTLFWCVQVECDTPLESSWRELQLCFKPHPNRRSELGVMSSQNIKSPN